LRLSADAFEAALAPAFAFVPAAMLHAEFSPGAIFLLGSILMTVPPRELCRNSTIGHQLKVFNEDLSSPAPKLRTPLFSFIFNHLQIEEAARYGRCPPLSGGRFEVPKVAPKQSLFHQDLPVCHL
jgi:hypothetical protein